MVTVNDLIGKNLSKDDFVFFWGHTDRKTGTGKNCLSQWYARPFIVDGLCYNCMEQFLMAEKARLFGDEDVEAQINEGVESDGHKETWSPGSGI